jgi:tRNA threonylcarbamoyl adenosine modification protein YeaZ
VLVLAFDTSTPSVTVAVAEAGPPFAVVGTHADVASNRHGELLAPIIQAVLDGADTAPCDLAAIAVGLGPGPFTGLRVGIVTANAMSDALQIPVYGACSLDVLAARHVHDDGPLAVLTDARRKQVYWALYSETGERLEGPEIGRPADVAESLRGRADTVAGAGALLYREDFTGFTVVESKSHPGATALASMVADKVLHHAVSDDLTPMYLRRPDAQPPGVPKKVTPV